MKKILIYAFVLFLVAGFGFGDVLALESACYHPTTTTSTTTTTTTIPTTTTTSTTTTTTIPTAAEFGSIAVPLAILLTTPAFAYLMVKRRK